MGDHARSSCNMVELSTFNNPSLISSEKIVKFKKKKQLLVGERQS